MIRVPSIFKRRAQRGSALLLVLGTIILMSTLVFGVVRMIDLDFDESIAEQNDFRARLLSESGLAFGMHAQISRTDPQRSQTMPDGGRFEVTITSENARININTILANEKTQRRILDDLFNTWGLKADERDKVIDCLYDWVDGDDRERPNGAERRSYEQANIPDMPKNRPFRSIEEMNSVLNWEIVAKAKPDWRNFFTIWTDGSLDLNSAEPEVIQSQLTLSKSTAEALYKKRLGRDGIKDTQDDEFFQNTDDIRKFLGLSEKNFQTVAKLVSAGEKVRRIESVGISGNFRHKTVVVATNQGGQGNYTQILEWQEP